MNSPVPAVKKSVTIDADVLASLAADRTANLSATVNESLKLVAGLDRERRLVEAWEAERGRPFTENELRPYVDVILAAELRNRVRVAREAAPSSTAV
ncbi:MAG: hypothetical protein ACRENL_04695 [Candidatus Dormibacteria bacterium]